jgi:hypothetical protein
MDQGLVVKIVTRMEGGEGTWLVPGATREKARSSPARRSLAWVPDAGGRTAHVRDGPHAR